MGVGVGVENGERRKEALFEAFADFCGVNTQPGLISNLPTELKHYKEIGVIALRSRYQTPALAPNVNHSRLKRTEDNSLHTIDALGCIACVLSHSVVSDSLRPHELHPTRSSVHEDSPGKNTGVDCHALLCFRVLGLNLLEEFWMRRAKSRETLVFIPHGDTEECL